MKILIGALIVATLVASPAFAQPYHFHGLDRPWVGPHGQIVISAARASALRAMQRRRGSIPGVRMGQYGDLSVPRVHGRAWRGGMMLGEHQTAMTPEE
jgi:hypothetical protein